MLDVLNDAIAAHEAAERVIADLRKVKQHLTVLPVARLTAKTAAGDTVEIDLELYRMRSLIQQRIEETGQKGLDRIAAIHAPPVPKVSKVDDDADSIISMVKQA